MTSQIRRRSSSVIPFGWVLDTENPQLLKENPIEQECLEYVHKIKDHHSLRKIANVIKSRTGRKISPEGVSKMLKRGY